VSEEEVRLFAHKNDLLYYETSALWNREDDESRTQKKNRGGIGVLIDHMVEGKFTNLGFGSGYYE